MRLLMFFGVATQAAHARLLSRQILEGYDFADIPAPGHVLRSWPVAGFAAVSIVERGFEMGRVFEGLLVKILMTGLTGICAYILCGVLLGNCARSARRSILRRCGQHRAKQSESCD